MSLPVGEAWFTQRLAPNAHLCRQGCQGLYGLTCSGPLSLLVLSCACPISCLSVSSFWLLLAIDTLLWWTPGDTNNDRMKRWWLIRRGSGISIPATGNIFQQNEPVKLPPQDQVAFSPFFFCKKLNNFLLRWGLHIPFYHLSQIERYTWKVNIGMYQFPGHLSYASLYPQPGPLLMNPPPYPTMQWAITISPSCSRP